MPSKIEMRCAWLVASIVITSIWLGCATTVYAQVGEVIEDENLDDDGGEREPSHEDDQRDDNRDQDEDDRIDEADAASAELDDYNHSALPYRVGADNGIEVGGHVLTSIFTLPAQPSLKTGLGFQGRIAIDAIESIVVEGNVGVMFNGAGSVASYTTAFLRGGARYPIDLHAKPVLFFVGAGAALGFFTGSTTLASGEESSTSAIAPAFDLQLGLMIDVHERIAIEGIVQGNYALPTDTLGGNSSSWIAFYAGISYDL